MTTVIIGTGASVMRALGGDQRHDIKHPVLAPPAIEGPFGRAWRCDLDVQRRLLNVAAENDGTVAHWIIEAPWAHPIWHSYSIILVHLRPLAHQRTARGDKTLIYLDGATHEMWVMAIDPAADRNEIMRRSVMGEWMTPKNFAAQFIAPSDDGAKDRIAAAVRGICDGMLSPDTDFQNDWKRLFGDNMFKDRPDPRPAEVRA